MIGLAEAGGDGLALAKDIYTEALAQMEELCAPYSTVIDIDPGKLPPTAMVAQWDAAQYAAAVRHDPQRKIFESELSAVTSRWLARVAANKGEKYSEPCSRLRNNHCPQCDRQPLLTATSNRFSLALNERKRKEDYIPIVLRFQYLIFCIPIFFLRVVCKKQGEDGGVFTGDPSTCNSRKF